MMTQIRSIVLTSSAAMALTLGACGGKKDSGADNLPAAIDFEISLPSSKSMAESVRANAPLYTITPDADYVFERLNMAGGEDALFTFDNRTEKDGVYTFTGIDVNREGMGLPDDVSFEIGKLVVHNPGKVDGHSYVSRYTAEDIKLSDTDGAITMTLDQVDIVNPSKTIFEVIDKAYAASENGKDMDDAFGEIIENMMQDTNIFSFFTSQIVMSGLSFELDEDDDGVTDMAFKFDHWTMGKDSETDEGLIDFSGYEVSGGEDGEEIEFSIGRIALTGIKSEFVSRLLDMNFNMDMLENYSEEELVGLFFRTVYSDFNVYDPVIRTQVFSGIEFSMAGVSGGLENMAASYSDGPEGKLFMHYVMENMVFDVDDDHTGELQEARAVMDQLGLKRFDMDAKGYCTLTEADDRYDCNADNNLFTIADAMDMRFGYDFTGFNKYYSALATGNYLDTNMAAMETLKLNDAEFIITDKGIMDKGFALAAEEMGVDVATAKDQAKLPVASLGMFAQNDDQVALIENFKTAWENFIDNGGTFAMRMTPTQPVSAEMFDALDPTSFDVKKLGLTFEQTP